MSLNADWMRSYILNKIFNDYGYAMTEWTKTFYPYEYWERMHSGEQSSPKFSEDYRNEMIKRIYKDYQDNNKAVDNTSLIEAKRYIKEHEADIAILNPEIWDKIKVILDIESIPTSEDIRVKEKFFNVKYVVGNVIVGIVFFTLSLIF